LPASWKELLGASGIMLCIICKQTKPSDQFSRSAAKEEEQRAPVLTSIACKDCVDASDDSATVDASDDAARQTPWHRKTAASPAATPPPPTVARPTTIPIPPLSARENEEWWEQGMAIMVVTTRRFAIQEQLRVASDRCLGYLTELLRGRVVDFGPYIGDGGMGNLSRGRPRWAFDQRARIDRAIDLFAQARLVAFARSLQGSDTEALDDGAFIATLAVDERDVLSECAVCLEAHESSRGVACLRPCGHTFCTGCIADMMTHTGVATADEEGIGVDEQGREVCFRIVGKTDVSRGAGLSCPSCRAPAARIFRVADAHLPAEQLDAVVPWRFDAQRFIDMPSDKTWRDRDKKYCLTPPPPFVYPDE